MEVVIALMQAGADVNFQNEVSLNSNLLILYFGAFYSMYVFLFDNTLGAFKIHPIKCNANFSDNWLMKGELTALHLAAWNGHVKVVNALLKIGADVNVQDWVSEVWHFEIALLCKTKQ